MGSSSSKNTESDDKSDEEIVAIGVAAVGAVAIGALALGALSEAFRNDDSYSNTSQARLSVQDIPSSESRSFQYLNSYTDLRSGKLNQFGFSVNHENIHLNFNLGLSPGKIYKCVRLPSFSNEYIKVKQMINDKCIEVINIEKIENPFLKKRYNLKKKQIEDTLGSFTEVQLFHGTLKANEDNICEHNFNWRLNDRRTEHIYGKGVNFFSNAMYAAQYSQDHGNKMLFVAKVLIERSCFGKENMSLPSSEFDTTFKQNDHIPVVKYKDNEFYPAYKINFTLSPRYHINNN